MSLFGWSYPAGCEGTPYDDEEPDAMIDRMPETIATLADLCMHFGADEPRGLNRRLSKDTACGASISVQTLDGIWHHNGEDWSSIVTIRAFTIQTIIEGSDAEVNSDIFVLPVASMTVDRWMVDMEAEATRLFDEANPETEGDADAL